MSAEHRSILQQFLLLLHQTLPAHWPVSTVVRQVRQQFRYVVQKPEYLERILATHPPQSQEYACAEQRQLVHALRPVGTPARRHGQRGAVQCATAATNRKQENPLSVPAHRGPHSARLRAGLWPAGR